MPNLTPNFSFNLPLVNNATDADLWGGQLNSNWSSLDGILPAPIASKYGAVVVQSTSDAAFEIISTQGSSGDVLISAGADALPAWTTKTASTTVSGFVELATDAEAQAGTDTTRAVTPDNLGATVIGIGQTWQNVSGSRTTGTSYQNTTGRPIQLAIIFGGGGAVVQVSSDNSTWVDVSGGSSDRNISAYPIVPNGWYYRRQTGSTAQWAELR